MRALKFQSRVFAVLIACAVLVMSGCATRPSNPDDPLERYNRAMFTFNDKVDRAIVKPIATAYDTVTPDVVQTGVGNFFGNLGDVWIGLNNMLQGKVVDGLSDWMRFVVNSTFGLFGLIDVASELGMQKNDEDFGQTLAVWGVGEGPYFVVPFFGPSTVRDTVVLPVDVRADPVRGLEHVATRNTLMAVRLAHRRARLLGLEKTLDEGTLDKYAFTRDFHLQQRRYRVHDGNMPMEYEDFDLDEEASMVPYETESDVVARSAVERLELVSMVETDADSNMFVIR